MTANSQLWPVKSLGELSPQHQRFVQEYLVDLNGAQAAIRAGYSAKTARKQASALVTNPDIWNAIQSEMAKRGERTEITAERVLRELGKIAFSDIRNVATWTENGVEFHPSEELDDDTAAAISEVSEKRTTKPGGKDKDALVDTHLKVKMHDKLKALEMCARHLGMFTKDDDEDARRKKLASIPDGELLRLVKDSVTKLEGE